MGKTLGALNRKNRSWSRRSFAAEARIVCGNSSSPIPPPFFGNTPSSSACARDRRPCRPRCFAYPCAALVHRCSYRKEILHSERRPPISNRCPRCKGLGAAKCCSVSWPSTARPRDSPCWRYRFSRGLSSRRFSPRPNCRLAA